MDVGPWLRSVGLEQYETPFRSNNIDDTVLPSLTAEDLKDLGVDTVGHRRKLLDAIAALRSDANGRAPSTEASPAIDRSTKDTAERRQLTIMFCDLVGSIFEDEPRTTVSGHLAVCGKTFLNRFPAFTRLRPSSGMKRAPGARAHRARAK